MSAKLRRTKTSRGGSGVDGEREGGIGMGDVRACRSAHFSRVEGADGKGVVEEEEE